MKRPALHHQVETQRPANPRRVPDELKPFLIEVARLLANDVLREEATRDQRARREVAP